MYLRVRIIINNKLVYLHLILFLLAFNRCSPTESQGKSKKRKITNTGSPIRKPQTIIIKKPARDNPSGSGGQSTSNSQNKQISNIEGGNTNQNLEQLNRLETQKLSGNTNKDSENLTHQQSNSGHELEVVKIEQNKNPNSSASSQNTYLVKKNEHHQHGHHQHHPRNNMSSKEKKAVKKYITEHKYILIEDDYPVQKRRFQFALLTLVAFSFYLLASILNPILGLVIAGTAALITGLMLLLGRSCLELWLLRKCLNKRKKAKRGDILTSCL